MVRVCSVTLGGGSFSSSFLSLSRSLVSFLAGVVVSEVVSLSGRTFNSPGIGLLVWARAKGAAPKPRMARSVAAAAKRRRGFSVIIIIVKRRTASDTDALQRQSGTYIWPN